MLEAAIWILKLRAHAAGLRVLVQEARHLSERVTDRLSVGVEEEDVLRTIVPGARRSGIACCVLRVASSTISSLGE